MVWFAKMLVMETRNYIKNRESIMENLFRKVTKSVVLFLCVLLGSSGAFAQQLTVDGLSETAVCPGDPIVLTTSKFPNGTTAADVLISSDGGNSWKPSGTSSDPSKSYTFVIDMGSSPVMFKVRSQGLKEPVETNTVLVQVETDCAKACHQSSSGEYINGTDFTPKSPNYSNSHSLGQLTKDNLGQVENYFPEQGITLKPTDCRGEISNDFGDFFGELKPKADEGNFSNYYWFTNPNSEMGNCTPFFYDFLLLDGDKNPVWDDKYYRMTLKSYIRLKCSNNCDQASVKLECSQGSHGNFYQNADHADIFVIDDLTGDTLGIKSINKSFDQIKVGDLFCKKEHENKLLRMEIHFYGRFSAQNKNANTVFEMKPLFQQFGCVQMAIDYISADVMSVCMDNGAACIGESVTVNAAGFPYGADYVWEVENGNGGWDRLIVNGYDVSALNYQTVNIRVDSLGKRRYRVGDANTIRTGESDYLYFDVTGKDCDPVQPEEIKVSDLCAPVDTIKFSVSPVDANPNVRYSWTLLDPKGNSIPVKFSPSGTSTGRGDTIYVSLNADNERGEYHISVQPITVRTSTDGSSYEEPAGVAINDSFIVYQKPVLTLSLNGYGPNVSESEKTLCPNDDEQGITAVVDPKYSYYEYVYSWNNATAQTPGGNVANVTLPKDSACQGLLTERSIIATAKIKDVEWCYATVKGNYTVDKLVEPTIDCDMLDDKVFTLGPTDKFYTLELPKPEFSAGCDSNPDIKVVVKTSPIDLKIPSEKTEFSISKKKWDSANKSVKLPAGTATVTYSVVDACGKEASCTATITIEDVTKPNLDCSVIDSFTTTTTEQGMCEATPDKHVNLPTLLPPVLTDQNGVDGEIEGVYVGRWYSDYVTTEPNADPEEFDSTISLTSGYKVGTSYILWAFKDASGNIAYCKQKIVVIDDTKPDVTCRYSIYDPQIVESFDSICGLSVNGLLRQVESPSAVDVCSGEGTALTPVIYISGENGGALDSYRIIEESEFDDLIFNVNQTYRIVWRYYKAFNDTVYEDCILQFKVEDKTAPVFDCTQLTTIYALANTYKELNKLPEYLDFASYDDVEKDGNIYEGTLKIPFDEGLIKYVTSSDVKDNCDNNVKVEVRVYDPSGAVFASNVGEGIKLNGIEDLKKLQFKVGANLINYTIKDASGNELQCGQSVVVSTGTTPEPDCPAEFVTIYADSNCEAEFVLTKEDVPTANVPVLSRGLYFVFPTGALKNEADLHKYFPSNDGVYKDNIGLLSDKSPCYLNAGKTHPAPEKEYVKLPALNMGLLCQVTSFDNWDLYNNGKAYEKVGVGPAAKINDIGRLIYWSPWRTGAAADDKMIGVSNSMSLTDNYTVYPYKIELLTSDGQPVLTDALIAQDSLYGTEDGTFVHDNIETVRYRYFRPRAFYPFDLNGNTEKTDKFDYVCEAKSLNRVNNYEETILSTKLRKGEYQLVYHFENQRNKLADDYQSVACTVKIVVEDTIPPTMDCSVIDLAVTKKTFAANEQCKVPMDSLKKYGFKEFSKDDLKVDDNCSERSNIAIEVERIHNSLVNKEHDFVYNYELEMGLTTFRWIITDESSNKDTCELEINVVDSTPPAVDCSKLPVITAYTTPNECQASPNAVVEAGLSTPEVNNDACTKVGTSDKIKGVGVRSDGKDIYGYPYPLGITTITWTFTDGAGNSSSCEQTINVKDTISPVFADCGDMEDLVYELGATECNAALEDVMVILGSHEAADVCSSTPIIGVPYLDNKGTLEDLPQQFARNESYKIAWVFTDGSGNKSICYQMLEIKDVTAPISDGVCPEPQKTVFADTECSVGFDDLQLPMPELNDPCDGIIIPRLVGKITMDDGRVNVYYDEQLKSIKYPVGTHTFLWIYADEAGNKDTCTMLLTVEDKIKPIVEDCEVSPNITVTVSDEFCEITPKELDKLLVHPKAYDECDDLKGEGGKHYIDPTILRFYDKNKNGVYEADELVLDANGFPIVWNSVNFPKGTTMIRWIFEDITGNKDSCEKTVTVEDHTPPFFDCSKIDPDTLRPEAPTCTYEFADLKRDVLNHLSYNAYDACTKDSIPGFLTTDGINPIPDSYTLQAGVIYKLLWVFTDEDGNKKTCNQWILPSHKLPLEVNCEEVLEDTISILAVEESCVAPQSAVLESIKIPSVSDPCGLGVVNGVPVLKSEEGDREIDLNNEQFNTGFTTLYWRFVSPWNLNDTVWCSQIIKVLGNKQFELLCDTLTPTYHDTILDCGPADPADLSIKTPWVADPCLTESDPEYKRVGVGVRSDGLAMTDPFPLGNTQIKWTFTDFTGGVDTFCIQDIELRTEEEMIVNCDAIEDVKVDVAEGECTVPSDKVQLPTPQYALHPCLKDKSGNPLKIEGVPSRGDKKELDEPYYVGRTLIIWTFTDTTNTLAKPVDTCHSYVQVGDVNEMPVECENFPDTLIELPDDKCELSWAEVDFEVKPVVDLCTREIIDPVVTIKSTGTAIAYKTYFVLEDGTEVEELAPLQTAKDTIVKLLSDDITFALGADTIVWNYDFKGSVFTCEQRISVKNKVAPSGGCESVDDTLTILAPTGLCEIPAEALVDSLMKLLDPWPIAYDHCDIAKENPINGKIYFAGKEITSDALFSLPVGENKVTWVFIDTAINLVGDTCEKLIVVQSDKAPLFDCKSLDTLNLETPDCEYSYEWTNENIPQAEDACTGDLLPGVGMRSDSLGMNAPYPIGKTTITWTFSSPYSTDTTVCEQVLWVRSTAEPLFECESLDTVELFVLDGMCDENIFTYLDTLTYPVALDSCTGIEIEGVPLTSDSTLFRKDQLFYVKDTTKIIWKFFNDSLNVNAKHCDQFVTVKSYNEPKFNCDSLKAIDTKFEITGCDTILGVEALPVPFALDYCTNDSIWGVPSRSDNLTMNDPFPVGITTVTWLFDSPYSEINVECSQDVVVLTSQEIDFDCESLLEDSIIVPVSDIDVCDTMGVVIPGQFANHPCPGQSGISKIAGVPFINKAVGLTPNADSTEWTIDKIHVGTHKITWTFTDPSDPATMLNPVKECYQPLQIGVGTNASVDCKNFPDTTIKLAPGDCEISWSNMSLDIKPVKDLCADTILVPVVYRSSGKAISATLSSDSAQMIITAEYFSVGVDTIVWEFESIGASCEQVIIVKDSMAPEFDCDTLPAHITLTAPTEKCEVISSAIYDSLMAMFKPWPTAIEKCTGDSIPARVFVDEINVANEITEGAALNVKVGAHKLIWLFVDSLINEVGKICEKDFTLQSDMAPEFNCDDLKPLSFEIEGCNTSELTAADIEIPSAVDACVNDYEVKAVGIRLNADSSVQVGPNNDTLSVHASYPVGTTIIKWSFISPFSHAVKVCYQNIIVKSSQELQYDCEILASKNLRITLDPLTGKTNPEAETSLLDTVHASHPCPQESGVEFVMGVPSIEGEESFVLASDSSKWILPALPSGTYQIVWTFTDTTETLIDPIKECFQELVVEDVIDTLTCPPGRNNTTLSCADELPDYFKTFDEFVSAGGSITDHNPFDESSFGYTEVIKGKSDCDEERYIKYYVLDVRKDTIACTDTFYIKDLTDPWISGLKDTTIQCSDLDKLPTFEQLSDVLEVHDNCDPSPTYTIVESDNQSDDPKLCNYYNYDIVRTYTITDRCGNVAEQKQVISVRDTIKPKFTFPDTWKDTVLSNYFKGCLFGVPDFDDEIRSMISDNCSDVNDLIIEQIPAANDTITKTTRVWVKVFDHCGNVDSISKVVYVQKREEILTMEAYDITKCASDTSVVNLWSQDTRYAKGFSYYDYQGYWLPIQSNPLYDCYRDSISEQSIVYSDNPLTYYGKFHTGNAKQDTIIRDNQTQLKRLARSGKYIFVATDTVTMCSDTASSFITLNERPRISIESGIMQICEMSTIDSVELFSFVKCVDDMGTEITNEGWTLGGDVYSFLDSVILENNKDNLIYFVENACGKTTSEDTYITFCGSVPTTKEDSLEWVGGSEMNLALLRSDDYKTKDSILMDVRKRFDSDAITINSQPSDPARIWKGEQVVLNLNTEYQFQKAVWKQVVGYFDHSSEVLIDSLESEDDIEFAFMEYNQLYELYEHPEDTVLYYVELYDGICPGIPGQLLRVDVLPKLPTAFTPYTQDGLNDIYMEGHKVVIFDRYGAKVFEGDNGWDGTFKGRFADPGVYFSKVFLNSGVTISGTIEIVKVK